MCIYKGGLALVDGTTTKLPVYVCIDKFFSTTMYWSYVDLSM